MQHTSNRPRIGVSACLLGKAVRFDGGHKQSRFVVDQCQQYFDVQSVCPEVELGLGIPRPVIQLRQKQDELGQNEVRLVFSKTPDHDITDDMRTLADMRMPGLVNLDGFIFKKDSPSCGMERVPVVNEKGGRTRNGVGIFAASFMQHYPDVPTEEEGRLNDIRIRENFLERVYAHYRWRQLEQARDPLQAFRDYHRNYKLVLMAKNQHAYRELGRMVAGVNRDNLQQVRQQYFSLFMRVMAKIPSRGQHVNVLMHLLGYLKNKLDAGDKAELLDWFETYRREQVNRITPLVLLRHHFQRHPNAYIAEQYYLSPFPAELMQPV